MSLGRTLEEQQNGRAISSQYTGDGKRTQIAYPGGRIIRRTFDALDRIKEIRDAEMVIAASDWIGPGMRELRRTNGNRTTLTFLNDASDKDVGYDGVKRVEALRLHSPTGVPLMDREYVYNRASQSTTQRRNDDFGSTDHYLYDSSYRVIGSAYDQDSLAPTTRRDLLRVDYQYDGVGNRRVVSRTSNTSSATTDNFAVNQLNEYTSISGVAYINDNNGNLTGDGRRVFSYDYKNRLAAVRQKLADVPIADYKYLPDGRRAYKTVYSTTNFGKVVSSTAFFWDALQVVEEQDGVSNAANTTYVWSPVYVDALLAIQSLTEDFYVHQNARFDVEAITDASGNILDRVWYDEFGQTENLDNLTEVSHESVVSNSYGFQGARLDSETGLLYFRARYYEPKLGRFLQRDPVWDGWNVGGQYSFVGNSPLSNVDPTGTLAEAPALLAEAPALLAEAPAFLAGIFTAPVVAVGAGAVVVGAATLYGYDWYLAKGVADSAKALAASEAAYESAHQAVKAAEKLARTAIEEAFKRLCEGKGHKMIVLYFKGPAPQGLTINNWMSQLSSGDVVRAFRGVRGYVSRGNKPGILDVLPIDLEGIIGPKPGHFSPRQLQDTEKLALMDAVADKYSGTYDYDTMVMLSLNMWGSCGSCSKSLRNYVAEYKDTVIYVPSTEVPIRSERDPSDWLWEFVKEWGWVSSLSGVRIGVGWMKQ